jgi:transposase-like protein
MSSTNGASKKPVETELEQKPARRIFTPEYKRRIVEEINAAPKGGIAAILRREGLYSTTVTDWRKEYSGAFEPKKRGRKPSPETPMKRELDRLERENQRLRRKLEHAELIIDVQKKVARMFEPPPETDDQS